MHPSLVGVGNTNPLPSSYSVGNVVHTPPFNSNSTLCFTTIISHFAVRVIAPIVPFAIFSTLVSPSNQPKKLYPSLVRAGKTISSSIVYEFIGSLMI